MAKTLFSFPTPFTPPTTEEDRLSALRLIRSRRVGPATYHRLIAEYGSATAALDALPEIARAAGVRDYRAFPLPDAMAELDAARRAGAWMLCHGAPEYPAALAALPDAPALLWAVGDRARLAQPAVAIVGARNASSLGQRMARALAGGLGLQGICVVSGLARGIDACAHAAALDTGTIAVLAGGVDVIYPSENAALAQRIAAQGLLLSEAAMGMPPQARHFPARNRIVSGLSHGVVVVEAALRSGSLITARDALDQGREVMAVPGHPFDARAAGCNQLLRDGATLVRGAEDVCAVIAPRLPAPERRRDGLESAPGAAATGTAREHDGTGTGRPDDTGRVREMNRRTHPAPQTGPLSPNAPAPDAHPVACLGDTSASARRTNDRAATCAPSDRRPALARDDAPLASATSHLTTDMPPGPPRAPAAPGHDAADPLPTASADRRQRSGPDPVRRAFAPDRAPNAAPDTAGAPPAQPNATAAPVGGGAAVVPRGENAAGPAGARAPRGGERPRGAPAESPGARAIPLDQQILECLGPSPLPEDQLIRDLGHPAALIGPALLLLELDGQVLRQPGGLLSRALPAVT